MISYTILGFLQDQDLTGYELKKKMQNTSFLPWSGNNNQIYKALLELLEDGMVTNEVQHQEHAPSKKIYSITPRGRDWLADWPWHDIELPEMKNMFLVRLAFAGQMIKEDIINELAVYRQRIQEQIIMESNRTPAMMLPASASANKQLLWELIGENRLWLRNTEVAWVDNAIDKIRTLYEVEDLY